MESVPTGVSRSSGERESRATGAEASLRGSMWPLADSTSARPARFELRRTVCATPAGLTVYVSSQSQHCPPIGDITPETEKTQASLKHLRRALADTSLLCGYPLLNTLNTRAGRLPTSPRPPSSMPSDSAAMSDVSDLSAQSRLVTVHYSGYSPRLSAGGLVLWQTGNLT